MKLFFILLLAFVLLVAAKLALWLKGYYITVDETLQQYEKLPNLKTVVLIFHPRLNKSKRNRLLMEQLSALPNVTVRDVSASFDGNVKKELELLAQFDRILVQFPIYSWNVPNVGKSYLNWWAPAAPPPHTRRSG